MIKVLTSKKRDNFMFLTSVSNVNNYIKDLKTRRRTKKAETSEKSERRLSLVDEYSLRE